MNDDRLSSWVGTWACAPQLTEAGDLPPAPGLASNTLRQVVHVTIGGSRLRLRFSNQYGERPVTLAAVNLAVSTGGADIDGSTDRGLAFSGAPSVTIPAGQTVVSDPLDYALPRLTTMAITIRFGATPQSITGHPGSRTTSYLQVGGAVDHWYFIAGIDVLADDDAAAAVITLGDSITDGRGSTTNGNDRWPDNLARRLQANAATRAVAVLNQGIGGNAVVSGGLGPTAVSRFARDVLAQPGARWLIVLEGINDIGGAPPWQGVAAAANLISAFRRFVEAAHAQGIAAYGVPILPFGGNAMYDTPEHQAVRAAVNDWIRISGTFDAVIDLDAVVRDPANPSALLAAYDTGDHLHLSPAGYQAMATAVDLTLFQR